jgi:hypothetical protein
MLPVPGDPAIKESVERAEFIAVWVPRTVIEFEELLPAVNVIPAVEPNCISPSVEVKFNVMFEPKESSSTVKPVMRTVVFSINETAVGVVLTGASLTGFIVPEKDFVRLSTPSFSVPPLSRTVTVIVPEPKAFGAGVKVNVPFGAMVG